MSTPYFTQEHEFFSAPATRIRTIFRRRGVIWTKPCSALVEDTLLFDRRALPIVARIQPRGHQVAKEVSRYVTEY